MCLKKLVVSQGCLEDLEREPNIEIADEYLELQFDNEDNMISPRKDNNA